MKILLTALALGAASAAAMAAPLTAELECLPAGAGMDMREWLAARLALRDIQLVDKNGALRLCFREDIRQQLVPGPGWDAGYWHGGWRGGWGGGGYVPAYEVRNETVLTLSARQAGSDGVWWQGSQALGRADNARQAREQALRALLDRLPQP